MGGRGSSYDGLHDTQHERYGFEKKVDPAEFFNDPETTRQTSMFDTLKENRISTRQSTDIIETKKLERQQKQIMFIKNEFGNILDNTTQRAEMQLGAKSMRGQTSGYTAMYNGQIRVVLDSNRVNNSELTRESLKSSIETRWHPKINLKDADIETVTHEMGHVLEYGLFEKIRQKDPTMKKIGDRELATKIRNDVKSICKKKFNYDNVWISRYGEENSMEWFAETFTNLMLSDHPTKGALALQMYLEEI